MNDRIAAELALLRKYYPGSEFVEEGRWWRVPSYALPEGWSPAVVPVVFQTKIEHPGTAPYGFFVPIGLRFNGSPPTNSYNESVSPQPPFEGKWGFFSWQLEAGWFATADVITGSNVLNFVRTFTDRFKEGV